MEDEGKLSSSRTSPSAATNPPQQLVWVIFGAAGHIGRSVAKSVLSHNDLVAAVGRLQHDTLPSLQSAFQAPSENCLPLLCDVRLRTTVDAAIQSSIAHFGRIDIIANCTGYGVIGACEDQDDYDIRNQFETNFFGTLNILHASLPYFRTRPRHGTSSSPSNSPLKQEEEEEDENEDQEPNLASIDHAIEPAGGRYLIFSSTSGALGVPGLGPYSATKHAVEGLIESMLYETHIYNIKATLVEPGHLRRDESPSPSPPPAAHNLHHLQPQQQQRHHHPHDQQSQPTTLPSSLHPHQPAQQNHPQQFTHFLLKPLPPLSPYSSPTSPAQHARNIVSWLGTHNAQPTSAKRSAELVWQLGHCRYPPLRLLLGGFAVESVRDRLRCVIEEIEEWRWLGFGSGEEQEGEGGEGEGEEGKGEGEAEMEG
ncbi:MAG: hypothetical protein Q9220_006923 [cf. Caloplaca sp. 1 TL-2023]